MADMEKLWAAVHENEKISKPNKKKRNRKYNCSSPNLMCINMINMIGLRNPAAASLGPWRED
eukprot:gene10000-18922_t